MAGSSDWTVSSQMEKTGSGTLVVTRTGGTAGNGAPVIEGGSLGVTGDMADAEKSKQLAGKLRTDGDKTWTSSLTLQSNDLLNGALKTNAPPEAPASGTFRPSRTSSWVNGKEEAGSGQGYGATKEKPIGLRIRLKASFDVSTLPRPARVIAIALQRYGMILADNGSSGYISGFSNPLFNDDALHLLNRIKGQDLEVVDTSTLRNG